MRYVENILLIFALLISVPAPATLLCSYAAYTPQAIQYFLNGQLNEAGVAVVPAQFFSGQSQNHGHFVVAGDSMLNGHMVVNDDRFYGTKSLQIFDARGRMIGNAVEEVKACRSGICRSTKLSVIIGGKPLSFGVSQSASRGVVYFIENNGQEEELNITIWRSQFDELIHSLTSTLLDFRGSGLMMAYSPTERLAISLATEPEILPYLPFIQIFLDGRGRLVISGRVNHGVYNRIIDQALNAGFYNIIPKVVIDSAVVFVGPMPPEDLRRCM
jgi:hypothetical protein